MGDKAATKRMSKFQGYRVLRRMVNDTFPNPPKSLDDVTFLKEVTNYDSLRNFLTDCAANFSALSETERHIFTLTTLLVDVLQTVDGSRDDAKTKEASYQEVKLRIMVIVRSIRPFLDARLND